MKWRSLVFVNILIIGISCQWNELPAIKRESCGNLCGVDNPLQDLPWLQEMVVLMEAGKGSSRIYQYFYVLQGELNGETVFIFDNCCPMCDTRVLTYNCRGEVVWEGRNRDDVQHEKVLWKPEGFECFL